MEKGIFSYGGEVYEYAIIKSRRKSVSISVGKDKEITVKTPLFLSEKETEALVESRIGWIVEKYKQAEALQRERPVHDYKAGELFLYRGRALTLNLIINPERTRIMVKKQADTLLIVSSSAEKKALKDAVSKWYREQAKEVISQKVLYYQKFIGRSIGDIRIKEQKSRWGSCSGKGNLNFNWKIIMAPDEMIDYLVVHELCHRLHMNHSKEFWNSVGNIIPDYKQKEEWLKENGIRLDL